MCFRACSASPSPLPLPQQKAFQRRTLLFAVLIIAGVGALATVGTLQGVGVLSHLAHSQVLFYSVGGAGAALMLAGIIGIAINSCKKHCATQEIKRQEAEDKRIEDAQKKKERAEKRQQARLEAAEKEKAKREERRRLRKLRKKNNGQPPKLPAPVVAKSLSPLELKNLYKDVDNWKDLNFDPLPETAEITQIKNDGHCLFRAIGWNLLEHFDRSKVVKKLQEFEEDIPEVKEALVIINTDMSAETIMCDATYSDHVVKMLRALSSTYGETMDKDHVFHPKSYYENMKKMDGEIKWGGGPEIILLGEALGISIAYYDISKGFDGNFPTNFTPERELSFDQTIQLLKIPGHYHALFIP